MGKNNMAPPRTFHFIIPCFLLDIHAEAWGMSNIEQGMMKAEGKKSAESSAFKMPPAEPVVLCRECYRRSLTTGS